MSSIYDTIAVWSAGDFVENDIREYPANSNQYWYSLKDETGNTAPTVGSVQWGGRTTFAIQSSSNTTNLPEFIWTPSYNQSAEISPRVLAVRFGDGYTQRIPDGINNNLLNLDLTFENRSEKEATAIAHFLNVRRGAEAFCYTPPSPYATQKLFICKSFTSTFVFNDNFTVSAKFEETPL
jgi:phage-related protein